MAKKYKAKTAAVFNGQPPGSTIEVDEAFARKYEALKYLEIVGEVKEQKPKAKADEKGKSAPKKSATKPKAKTKPKGDK